MQIIRIILWGLALILLLIVLFPPIKSAGAEPIIQKDIKLYSVERVIEEFGGGQWTYFNQIIYRESNWNHLAQNSKSSAFGYAQFLNSTWETVGCVKTSDPYKQVDCAIKYVKERYKTPKKALAFHQKNNYY